MNPSNPAMAPAFAISLALCAALLTSTTGLAQQTQSATSLAAERHFDIAPQSLTEALPLFGRQAGVQVSVSGEVVRGLRTGGVQGTMPVATALRGLLGGTGLVYRIGSGDTVLVEQAGDAGDGSLLLGPIVVAGSGLADRHAGAADRVASTYVTADDLERRNPATVKQVFAGEAAVSVGGAQPLSQKVYVQGVEETNLAVSIDGARQNNRVFHHSGNNLIDPALLKLARVDPGVAPADAGPGALGGAIVYETVDVDDVLAPGRAAGGFVTASHDSNGRTFDVGVSGFGRSEGVEVLGFAKVATGEDYDDGDGREVDGTGTDLGSVLAKFAHEGGGQRLEVSVEHLRDRADRPFRANMRNITTRNDPVVRRYDLSRRNFVVNWSTPGASGLLDPRVVVGYGISDLGVPVPYGSVGKTSSLSARAENDFHLAPGHTITAGVDFYDDTARYEDPTTKVSESALNVGAYAQARLQPLDPLRLSFGLRGDRQSFEGIDGTGIDHAGLSGNASGALELGEHVTLSAGYSNVWGGVALAENFIMNPAWSYANGVKPVRADNVRLGADFHRGPLSLGIAAYRSDFEDARVPTYGGGPGLVTDFRTHGFEISGTLDWGSGFVRASYADTTIKVNGVQPSSFTTQYLGAPLGRVIALEAAQTLPGTGVRIGGVIDAALEHDDTVRAGGNELESYQVVSVYAEYQPPSADFLTLRLQVDNLFDEPYADRATYGQDFTTVEPLAEPGRSLLLLVKARF